LRYIYAKTKSLFIWLGPSFRGETAALEVLPDLAIVKVKRHLTRKQDMEKVKDVLAGSIKVLFINIK